MKPYISFDKLPRCVRDGGATVYFLFSFKTSTWNNGDSMTRVVDAPIQASRYLIILPSGNATILTSYSIALTTQRSDRGKPVRLQTRSMRVSSLEKDIVTVAADPPARGAGEEAADSAKSRSSTRSRGTSSTSWTGCGCA